MRSDLRLTAALLALSAGCSYDWDGLRPNGAVVTPDVPTDTTRVDATDGSRTDVVNDRAPSDVTVNDAPDASDVLDASDVADAVDVTDVTDAMDASDVSDASDVRDVTDASDASDAMDAADVADVRDASDVIDASDVVDVTDVVDVVDVTDVAVDTGPTCTGAAMTCPCSPTNAGGYCRPGESCTSGACVPGTVFGSLVISEIMNDPSAVGDETGEWFEVYNPGSTPLDIRGMRISNSRAQSATITSSTPLIIAPRAYATLGRSANMSTNGGVTELFAYGSLVMTNVLTFANPTSTDSVIIDLGSTPTEIDRVAYEGATSSLWPRASGKSKSLRPDHLNATDNDNPMNWCNAPTQWALPSSDYGSPGVANPVCP